MRDSVLACLEPELDGAADVNSARDIISENLDGIRSAAEEAAEGRPVTVTLSREFYPTRDYGSFSLPAGSYESLRVVLGEGEGHNWWCVVFPPLCLSAAEAEDALETLGQDSAMLLTGDSDGIVFKFRLLELWGELHAAARPRMNLERQSLLRKLTKRRVPPPLCFLFTPVRLQVRP